MFSDQFLWPRGLPLNEINNKQRILKKKERRLYTSPIQQSLSDHDPDVDAIYRLIYDKKLTSIYYYLGECYKNINDIDKALSYYALSHHQKTNSRILECYFILNKKKEYQKKRREFPAWL